MDYIQKKGVVYGDKKTKNIKLNKKIIKIKK